MLKKQGHSIPWLTKSWALRKLLKLTPSNVNHPQYLEILTKRSTKPNNKENISANGHKLKKIK